MKKRDFLKRLAITAVSGKTVVTALATPKDKVVTIPMESEVRFHASVPCKPFVYRPFISPESRAKDIMLKHPRTYEDAYIKVDKKAVEYFKTLYKEADTLLLFGKTKL